MSKVTVYPFTVHDITVIGPLRHLVRGSGLVVTGA
jgi:hypothetical protein